MKNMQNTIELIKKGIDFDVAKEMQNAKPSFSYVPQLDVS